MRGKIKISEEELKYVMHDLEMDIKIEEEGIKFMEVKNGKKSLSDIHKNS
jgi:hypothetical protein